MVLGRYAGSVCGTEFGVAPTEIGSSTGFCRARSWMCKRFYPVGRHGLIPVAGGKAKPGDPQFRMWALEGLRNPWSRSRPLRLLASGGESERL